MRQIADSEVSQTGKEAVIHLLRVIGDTAGRMPDWMVRLGIRLFQLYYAACCLLPVRKSVAVFSSFPDGQDNSYAMFLYLRDGADAGLSGIACEWLVGNDFNPVVIDVAGARLLRRVSLSAIRATATAEYVFHTHGIYRFARKRGGQTIVNLWHGMPLKAIGAFDPQVRRLPLGDVAIATSDFFRRVIAKAFLMSETDVLVSGQPRNDLLVRSARQTEPDIILWMPTYRASNFGDVREDSPFNKNVMLDALRQIDAGLEGKAARLVLKLHPMDVLNAELTADFRNVQILRRTDPQPPLPELMASSRALITDYSSAAIDFAVLDRPLGYFCPDRDEYARGFVPDVADVFYAAGTMLDDIAELVAFILAPPAQVQPILQLVKDRDDRAAARIWASLQERK